MNEPDTSVTVTPAWHVRVWRRHAQSWAEGPFRLSMLFASLAFVAGLIANSYAVAYATERASNYVTDIILSNTPVFDVDFVAVYGMTALIIFITLICILKPRRAPFTLYSLGLFFAVRAVFLSLTHLGPFPTHSPIQFNTDIGAFLAQKLIAGNDLFFSAHTGAPFLMALLFWHRPALRNFFLAASVFFGVVMLLGHLHYTIDVLSAFFISYGIYHMAVWLFPRERALFLAEE